MFKVGLWVGAPALITFLASSSAVRLENALFVFVLSVFALFMGIGPRSSSRSGH